MLGPLEWWNFTDWSKGFTNGIPPGVDNGNSANVSMQYALALKNAVDIYAYFGDLEKAEEYEELAKSIQQAIYRNCFDEEKRIIAERPEKDVFSQHTNIFGIIGDAFTPDVQTEIMKNVLEDKELIRATIYFRFYLHRAMLEAGFGNQYFEMMAPWKNMLEMGMTTFGEKDEHPRSDCHGWSASSNFDFINLVAGVQSTSPGFQEVLIEPNLGHLKELKASFPHPNGMLKVVFTKNKKGKISGAITLPEGVSGIFKANGQSIKLKAGNNKI